jgi:nanoRNase/pAp phosphatase (c-di-AMP/oligoRNAs hydrolase)
MPDPLKEILTRELSVISKSTPRVLIFTHRQADPDAVCAAFGLENLIAKIKSDGEVETKIVVPQGTSALGQLVCTELGIKFVTDKQMPKIGDCDLLLIVDTGDSKLLAPFEEQIRAASARKILIDHHSTNIDATSWGIDAALIEPNATSTCEIITRGFDEEELSKDVALTLLVGLMFDSQHFGIATARTLEAALVLLRMGAVIETAKALLRRKPERSELLARVKSAQRLQYEEVGKYLILKTEVSSFHASVARMLIEIGADVGIAFGRSDGEARVSVRSTQSFCKETGIDFALELKQLAEARGMVAGGHPTAASASGGADASPLIKDLAIRLNSLLKAW